MLKLLNELFHFIWKFLEKANFQKMKPDCLPRSGSGQGDWLQMTEWTFWYEGNDLLLDCSYGTINFLDIIDIPTYHGGILWFVKGVKIYISFNKVSMISNIPLKILICFDFYAKLFCWLCDTKDRGYQTKEQRATWGSVIFQTPLMS